MTAVKITLDRYDPTRPETGEEDGVRKDFADVLQLEQYRSLTKQVPILYSVVIVTALMLCAAFDTTAPSWLIIGVPAVMLAFIAARLRYWLGVRKRVDLQDAATIRRDILSTTILGPVITLVFAFVGISLMNYGAESQQSLAIVAIWVTAVASAFCLFALPQASYAIVLCAGLPLSISFALRGTEVMILLSVTFAVISGLIIYMLKMNFAAFSEIVQSRAIIAEKHRQAEAAKEAATTLAYTDYLTRLPNRRHFEVLLAERVATSSLKNEPFAVGMLDLDGFKPINDMHGHSAGDDILRQVASRLRLAVEERGRIARMGGDEFAFIVEGAGTAMEAIAFGSELQAIFAEPFVSGPITARLTCTCGFSLYPSSGEDPDRLIDRADIALYNAKGRERSGIAVFDTNDESIARERAMIEQELRKALEKDAFTMHFQPIVDLPSGKLNGFEALARWHNSKLGQVSPAVFIPIAEQIGVIEQLTETLLHQAARAAAQWPDSLVLSFNLSAEQLVKPGAALKIIAAITEAGLPPRRFDAEVTETAIMRNLASARRTIETLKSAGARISLDDFGTGYSSLSQIKDLPLDKVKIDKSFIDRICVDARIASLVGSIIDMCARLDLKCVAEGIERPEQLETLKRSGCGGGQGYLFSRPIPGDQVKAFIAKQALRNAA